MFDSPVEATNALLDYFDRPRVEIIAKALVPAIIFHPSSKEVVAGQTRLGGTPDVPEGFVWPRPAPAENPEEIAKRGNEEAATEMRAHLALGLPYAFVAQVDLAEAASLGAVASPLPSDGRLLFFYDFAVGPWDTGTRVAKVIWERSPAEQLHGLAKPRDLAEAEDRALRERAGISAEFGDGENTVGGSNYGAPARAMMLHATWRLPSPHAIEINGLPDLAAVARGETSDPKLQELYAAYEEALEEHGDQDSEQAWQRHQLLGSPLPAQGDPRFDAVVVSEWGKQHLSREEWTEHREDVFRKARDWVLLLQIDIGDWMQASFVEGTVYFVVHQEHLEQRKFDEVIAVYQQT